MHKITVCLRKDLLFTLLNGMGKIENTIFIQRPLRSPSMLMWVYAVLVVVRILGPIKPSFIERRQHIFPHKKGHGDLLTTLASCWHATIYWDSTCRRREALGITLKYNKGIAALSGRPFFHPLLILDFSLQDPHSISRLSVFVNGISISAIKLSSCARPGFLFHTDKYERRAWGGYDAGLDSDCLLR